MPVATFLPGHIPITTILSTRLRFPHVCVRHLSIPLQFSSPVILILFTSPHTKSTESRTTRPRRASVTTPGVGDRRASESGTLRGVTAADERLNNQHLPCRDSPANECPALQVELRSHREVNEHGDGDTHGHDSERSDQPLPGRWQRLGDRDSDERGNRDEELRPRPLVGVGDHEREVHPREHLQQCEACEEQTLPPAVWLAKQRPRHDRCTSLHTVRSNGVAYISTGRQPR